jgi:adenine C2-methylase RlmN of 23S rRNA A2503 and tRNA A37
MGEPLNNYENVIEACRGMIDRRRWNLSHNRVTVSTVGVTPKMRKLTKELPEVNLALSLHAPNQEARIAIVPTAKMYPIQDMIDALDEHMMALEKSRNGKSAFGPEARKSASKKKRAMIEYVMLEGDSSSIECAHQLGELCKNRHLVVNLIPYNQTDVKDKLRCPSEKHMKEFQKIVTSYGSFCFIRRTMGADIAGACGQLVVTKENSAEQPIDIEDGPFKSKVTKQIPKVKVSRNSKIKKSSDNQTPETNISEDIEESENSIEKWIRPLAIATAIAASCFTLSAIMVVSKRRAR